MQPFPHGELRTEGVEVVGDCATHTRCPGESGAVPGTLGAESEGWCLAQLFSAQFRAAQERASGAGQVGRRHLGHWSVRRARVGSEGLGVGWGKVRHLGCGGWGWGLGWGGSALGDIGLMENISGDWTPW